MKTTFKHISLMALTACAGFTFASCNAEKDYYDPENADVFRQACYEKAFTSQFGNIKDNQTWDFSILNDRSTRAVSFISPEDLSNQWSATWTEIDQEIISSLGEIMIEGTMNTINGKWWSNKHRGSSFVWTVPNNDFTITPIFQGKNSWNAYVQMNVTYEGNTESYILWDKKVGQPDGHIQRKVNGRWEDAEHTFGTTLGFDESKKPVLAILAEAVRSQTLTFKKGDLPVGATVSFEAHSYKDDGRRHDFYSTNTSPDMISLDQNQVPHWPSFVPEDHEYKILACEAGEDEDLNDIIFLIEGKPYVPQTSTIENGQVETYEVESKRYMVEDLGATQASDIDFNDLVVDLVETKTYVQPTEEYTYNNGTSAQVLVGERSLSKTEQKAVIRALGGTKDITLYVGDQLVFQKSASSLNVGTMYNTGVGETFEPITIPLSTNPWISRQNNITIVVGGNGVNNVQAPTEASWKISFPVDGSVPSIIAVDTTQKWNDEYISVFTPGSKMDLKKLAAE